MSDQAAAVDEPLTTITCGRCAQARPFEHWRSSALGPLPDGEFQCPACGHAFRRGLKPAWPGYGKSIELVPVEPQLQLRTA